MIEDIFKKKSSLQRTRMQYILIHFREVSEHTQKNDKCKLMVRGGIQSNRINMQKSEVK